MKGVNLVILVGNAGREPEVKTFDSGKIASVSIGTNSYKKKDQLSTGAYTSHVEWHRLVFYNELADVAQKYICKGKKIYIQGYLRTRKYTDKNNQQQHSTEIVVSEVQFFTGDEKHLIPNEKSAQANSYTEPDFEDDIPY